MNSGTVLAGNEGFTSRTIGTRMMLATGAMSRMKLKLSLSYSVALIAFVPLARRERVAVRRRAHDRLGGDIAAGARPVVDDELLTEPLRQPLTHQARDDVELAAGRKADDQCAPAAPDRLAPSRRATRPAARQRPRPDAEIAFGGEVSSSPSLFGGFIRSPRRRAIATRWERQFRASPQFRD